VIPEVPGFAGDISDEGAVKATLAAQSRTINCRAHSIYEELKDSGFGPCVLRCAPVLGAVLG
jgi:phospholipase D1/2